MKKLPSSSSSGIRGAATHSVISFKEINGSQEVHDRLFDTYLEHNDRVHSQLIRSFPDTTAVLGKLAAAGLPLGIVTSKRSVTVAALWGMFAREELLAEHPDYAITTLSELVPIAAGK